MHPGICDVSGFNACDSAKRALTLFIEAGMTAADAGKMLYEAHEADAELLGECIGHHAEYWQELCHSFPRNFSFGGMSLQEALRAYLWRFRLPGESGPIGRIIEGFAAAYYEQQQRQHPRPLLSRCAYVSGWYTRQPMTFKDGKERPCCVGCGKLDDGAANNALLECGGCGVVRFCPSCRGLQNHNGHAIGGRIGFGRACVAARRLRDADADSLTMRYQGTGKSQEECTVRAADWAPGAHLSWQRVSPFRSEDAVMVLAYAMVMLSTNLHNPAVKASQKMALHEFLSQCRGTNDGCNFPGDFLMDIYAGIEAEELKVMRPSS